MGLGLANLQNSMFMSFGFNKLFALGLYPQDAKKNIWPTSCMYPSKNICKMLEINLIDDLFDLLFETAIFWFV